MRKLITLVTTLLLGGLSVVNAQIFSDNFDSYTAGDYLTLSNPTWDTWSGGSGTTEDVKISDANAASAPNSLHFKASSASGGPTDIILRFDQVYTSGNFDLSANFFIESNQGAYFNLQQNHNVGEVWAVECFMLNDGTLIFRSNNTTILTATYPNGQWFNLKLSVDLTTNEWNVLVDGSSVGTFTNPVNSVGILDIYPVNPTSLGGNGQSEFYVDDVSYNQTPAVLPTLNAGVTQINQIDGLAGQQEEVTTKIRNMGQDTIHSFDLKYTYPTGNTVTENVTGITLPSLGFYTYTFPTKATLVSGSNNLSVTVSNVNGNGADDDASDDTKSITIDPVVPAPGKIVVGEEATGTWCQYCPRGHVYMEMMKEKYAGFWAGVSVHNNDPMTVATYDAGLASFISGYPTVVLDRTVADDPSLVESHFIQEVIKQPTATITNGATYDPVTRKLDVTLTYNFVAPLSGTWSVACALAEDSVTGTGSQYNQQNAYSGGGNGVMGGYDTLPNPVPYSMMVYQDVARAIAPSFQGAVNKLPTSIAIGETHTVCFSFTLAQDVNVDHLHIIGMLINTSGKIDNGSYSTVAEAVANGLATCDADVSEVKHFKMNDDDIVVFPNPSNGLTYIQLKDKPKGNVSLVVMDLAGKVVASKVYNSLEGNVQLPINTNLFAAGTYIIKLNLGNSVYQKKLIVK